MNNTTKRAWPSYERIHEITGYSRDTIERAIRQLIGSGYLFRERKAPITGGRALVHYGLRALHPSRIDRMISAAVEEFRRQRPAPEADPVINSGVGLTREKQRGQRLTPAFSPLLTPVFLSDRNPTNMNPFSLCPKLPFRTTASQGLNRRVARSTLRSLRPSGAIPGYPEQLEELCL